MDQSSLAQTAQEGDVEPLRKPVVFGRLEHLEVSQAPSQAGPCGWDWEAEKRKLCLSLLHCSLRFPHGKAWWGRG